MKLKLINLESEQVNSNSISQVLDILDQVDYSDYGYERESAFEDLLQNCRDLQQQLDKLDIIQEQYQKVKSSLLSLFEESPNIDSIVSYQSLVESMNDILEDFVTIIDEDDTENIDDFIDALNEYQECYGGLGKMYIEL